MKKIATDGAELLKKLADETDGNFTFEYSPESFQGTEVDYALEVCNAVLDIWKPTADHKAIINLPTTVENAMPHVFASQVEYFNKHLLHRENVVLSLHPHNDRGSGSAMRNWGSLQARTASKAHCRKRRAYRQCGYHYPCHEYVLPGR